MERSAAATARAVAEDEQPADAPVTPDDAPVPRDEGARPGRASSSSASGDFYELFFEDAVRASELLGITLTARARGPTGSRCAACRTTRRAGTSAKLLEAGHKVAICEQVEEPGPVRASSAARSSASSPRAWCWTRRSLEPRAATSSPRWSLGDGACGAALLDASTGEFRALQGRRSDAAARGRWPRTSPREVLVPADASAPRCRTAVRAALRRARRSPSASRRTSTPRGPAAFLRAHFGVADPRAASASTEPPLAIGGRRRGAPLPQGHPADRGAAHVDRLRRLRARATPRARRGHPRQPGGAPDACGTAAGRARCSGVLDRTVTALGARRLAEWLPAPLLDLAAIRARQDAVEELSTQGRLARGAGRAAPAGRGHGAALRRLAAGPGNAAGPARARPEPRRAARRCAAALDGCRAALLKARWPGRCRGCRAAGRACSQRALVDSRRPPSTTAASSGPATHAELDELWASPPTARTPCSSSSARARAHRHSGRSRSATTGSSATTSRSRSANLHLVPPDYDPQADDGRRRALRHPGAQGVRGEGARRRGEAHRAGARALRELRGAGGGAGAPALRAAAEAVATADALLSLARVRGGARLLPARWWTTRTCSSIDGGAPPGGGAARSRREPFVPNDVASWTATTLQLVVITGPNMAGKSTVMRQVGAHRAAGAGGQLRPGAAGAHRPCATASSPAWARPTTWRAGSPPSWWR